MILFASFKVRLNKILNFAITLHLINAMEEHSVSLLVKIRPPHFQIDILAFEVLFLVDAGDLKSSFSGPC